MSQPSRLLQTSCSNVRIATTSEAVILFHAVAMRKLPMIHRRLDPEERKLIRPGDTFIWEQSHRGMNGDVMGVGMERWTDGRSWGPSRTRDDFLFYHEKESENDDLGYTRSPNTSKLISVDPSRYMRDQHEQIGPRAPTLPLNATGALDPNRLIKQTYSVLVYFPNEAHLDTARKWHLTTYFTRASLPSLRPVRDVPGLRDLVIPEDVYRNPKVPKPRKEDVRKSSQSAPSPQQAGAISTSSAVLPGLSVVVDGLLPRLSQASLMSPRDAPSLSPTSPTSGLPSPQISPHLRRTAEDERILRSFGMIPRYS